MGWKIIGADGHLREGKFSFSVAAPVPETNDVIVGNDSNHIFPYEEKNHEKH